MIPPNSSETSQPHTQELKPEKTPEPPSPPILNFSIRAAFSAAEVALMVNKSLPTVRKAAALNKLRRCPTLKDRFTRAEIDRWLAQPDEK